MEIAVFNGTGNKLASYNYNNQPAGNYTIAIDKNTLTQAALYYYTLHVNGKLIATKKMIKL